MKFFSKETLVQFFFALFAILLLIQTSTVLAGTPLPTPVPEPGPLGLLALGFVALVATRRVKKNK